MVTRDGRGVRDLRQFRRHEEEEEDAKRRIVDVLGRDEELGRKVERVGEPGHEEERAVRDGRDDPDRSEHAVEREDGERRGEEDDPVAP